MKFAFDTGADVLYITVRHGEHARTVEAGQSAMVDVDSDGNLLGIELLAPGEPWPLEEILARWPVDHATAAKLREYAGTGRSPRRGRPSRADEEEE